MNDYSQDKTFSTNENNRYTNQETEKIFDLFLNNNKKLTNSNHSNERPKNSYKNFVNSISYKYKNNYRSINTESNKYSIIDSNRKETIDSMASSYKKSYLPTINKYNAKVIIENFRQSQDILYLLDVFISENNYQKNYEIQQETNKIIILFYQEDMAFNFIKILNNYKSKNNLYNDMKVNLSLTQKDNYNKYNSFGTIKRRGISTDTIQRLFQGIGGRKREKKENKKKLKILINSPYYSLNNKLNKSNDKNANDILKDYNKFPIRVLDSDYQPLRVYNFRSEEKTKWISPTNFHI